MQEKLTKRLVDSLSATPKDTFLWDTEVKGFGLKITPKGRKVYVVQKRLNGHLRRFTIGTHGSPWTPELARADAGRILNSLASGVDPEAEKKKAKADITIAELCDIYMREGTAAKKASTLAVDKGRIERHVKPLLGKVKLNELTRGQLERFQIDVASGKTAMNKKGGFRSRSIVRGGSGTATRTMGMLGAILQFAVNRELRPDNPARGIKRKKDRRIERMLSRDELQRLAQALAISETDGTNPQAVSIIRLLMLTGCRKSEIVTLMWKYVDFERKLLFLPDSKTGAKVVPLSDAAIAILEKVPRIEGRPEVFPAESQTGFVRGLQKMWERIRAKADLEDLRLHDLRHHFISVGASSGESLYILGKLAGHRSPETTQRYAHLAEDPVRDSANRIAEQIAKAFEISSPSSD